MKRKIISILVILFILFHNLTAYAGAQKDETVYVMLGNDGSVQSINVVNHVYGFGPSDVYTDYGRYTSVKNLTGPDSPQVSGDSIVWPASSLQGRDLYYEGIIQKELPVSAGIKYYLDGKLAAPAELAGANGHLKIEVNIRYNGEGRKYGLLAQIQIPADLDIFTSIKCDGSKVVVGKTATLTFVALPPEEQTFTVEMDGKDITLDPITISLVSSEYTIPKDIRDGIDQLSDGLKDMSDGASGLETGMNEVADGTRKLRSGTVQLSGGLVSIYGGYSEIYKQSGSISEGMKQFEDGLARMAGMDNSGAGGFRDLVSGMEQLSQKSGEINDGLKGLRDGVVQLKNGYMGVGTGMDGLQSGHEQLVLAAQLLLTSSDPVARQVAQGIIDEYAAIKVLNSGLDECNKGMDGLSSNIGSLYNGYGQFDEGLKKAADSVKLLEQAMAQLPAALKQMYDSFKNLRDGTDHLFSAMDQLNAALKSLKDNTQGLPGNIDRLISGQGEIGKGIHKLNYSGIKKMEDELEKTLDNSFLGSKEGESYTSFVDNQKNKNSTVQFVMRTEGIQKPKAEKPQEAEEVKKSIIDRFLDLFK